MMIPVTSIFSQDTLKITSDQLKTTNLIFLEHSKLKKENQLLNRQLNNYLKIDSLWNHTDSIRKSQLDYYSNINIEQKNTINSLQKSLKRKNNILLISLAVILTILCVK